MKWTDVPFAIEVCHHGNAVGPTWRTVGRVDTLENAITFAAELWAATYADLPDRSLRVVRIENANRTTLWEMPPCST